jgi:hypothetical protein
MRMKKDFSESGQGIVEIIVFILVLIGLASFLKEPAVEGLEYINEKITNYTNGRSATEIVLAGKVVDVVNDEWLNDRLVVVFVNGTEVARTVSKTGEYTMSGEGTHDGLFVISFPNTYKLT